MNGETYGHYPFGEPPRYEAEVLLDPELQHLLTPPIAAQITMSEDISLEAVVAEYARPFLDDIAAGADQDNEEPRSAAVAETTKPFSVSERNSPIIAEKPAAKRRSVRLLLGPSSEINAEMDPDREDSVISADVKPPVTDESDIATTAELSHEQHKTKLPDSEDPSRIAAARENIPSVKATVRFGQYEELIVFVGAAAEKLRQNRKHKKDAHVSVDPPESAGRRPVSSANKAELPASGPRSHIVDLKARVRQREFSVGDISRRSDFEEQDTAAYQLEAINTLDEQGIRMEETIVGRRDGEAYFTDPRILDVLKTVCLEQKSAKAAEAASDSGLIDLLAHEERRLLLGFRNLAAKLRENTAGNQKQQAGLRRRVSGLLLPGKEQTNEQNNIASQYIKVQQQLRRQANPQVKAEDLRPEKIIADKIEELRHNLSPQSFLAENGKNNALLVNAGLRQRYFSGRPANQQLLFASQGRGAVLLTYTGAHFLLESASHSGPADQEYEVLTATPLTEAEYSRLMSTAEYLMARVSLKQEL